MNAQTFASMFTEYAAPLSAEEVNERVAVYNPGGALERDLAAAWELASDIITSINSRTVNDVSDVLQEVGRADDGGSLPIVVTRDRKEMKLTATMPPRERPAVRAPRRSI